MKNDYMTKIHRIGRIGVFIGLCFMFGIPTVIGIVYDEMPSISDIFRVGGGLFAVFAPIAIVEFLSYTPILGSAGYISFLTGNVLNLKLPCAISAMEQAGAQQGTEKGDTISTMAVAASSMMTTAVIALGVVLLVPLQPILTLPAVKTATTYMLPAMFGALFLGMFVSGGRAGNYTVKGKNWVIVPALVIISAIHFSGLYDFSRNSGLAIFLGILIICATAPIFLKLGIIKMKPIDNSSAPIHDKVKSK